MLKEIITINTILLLRKYQIKIGDIKNIDNKLKGINMNIKQK